jgi:RNA polymerase sporulation-specific sigma factor
LKKLTDEQRKMVEDNLPLVTFIAKRYFSKTDYIKNQDILQEGILAMVKAIPKYDSDKAKLSTYLYPTIDGRLKYFSQYQDRLIPIPHQKHLKEETIAKADNAKFVLSLDLEYKKKDNSFNEPYTLMNVIPDNKIVDIEEETINRITIIDAIKSLEWREKIVIVYRFYFDLNQTYIGELMGISQVHVHRLQQKAQDKIKKYILG